MYTLDQTARMQAEWDEATIAKAKIDCDAQAPFKWAEYIHDLGDKLGKSHAEKRAKYLRGFPEAFNVIIMSNTGNRPFHIGLPARLFPRQPASRASVPPALSSGASSSGSKPIDRVRRPPSAT